MNSFYNFTDYVQCDICLRKFTKMSYLTRHKAVAHSLSTDRCDDDIDESVLNRKISCILCGSKFSREDQLISHINLSHSTPRKRGRPSKKDILLNKQKLKRILESVSLLLIIILNIDKVFFIGIEITY